MHITADGNDELGEQFAIVTDTIKFKYQSLSWSLYPNHLLLKKV